MAQPPATLDPPPILGAKTFSGAGAAPDDATPETNVPIPSAVSPASASDASAVSGPEPTGEEEGRRQPPASAASLAPPAVGAIDAATGPAAAAASPHRLSSNPADASSAGDGTSSAAVGPAPASPGAVLASDPSLPTAVGAARRSKSQHGASADPVDAALPFFDVNGARR
jgi:hypothetical protein